MEVQKFEFSKIKEENTLCSKVTFGKQSTQSISENETGNYTRESGSIRSSDSYPSFDRKYFTRKYQRTILGLLS